MHLLKEGLERVAQGSALIRANRIPSPRKKLLKNRDQERHLEPPLKRERHHHLQEEEEAKRNEKLQQ